MPTFPLILTQKGYVPHIDPSNPDGADNIYFVVTHRRDRYDNPPVDPATTNLELVVLRANGTFEQIGELKEYTYTLPIDGQLKRVGLGKHGFGGITVRRNGDIVVFASESVLDLSKMDYKRQALRIYIITEVAVPW